MIKQEFIQGIITFYVLQESPNKESKVIRFLQDLKITRPDEYHKVINKLNRWKGRSEIIVDSVNFAHEEEGIYVIKGGQTRLYGFFDGRDFIITNGDIKKQNRADPNQLKRAKEYRFKYKGVS